MQYNGPVDNDVYCAAIAKKKNMTIEGYRATLDKDNPYNDPNFIKDKGGISLAGLSDAMPDVYEEKR